VQRIFGIRGEKQEEKKGEIKGNKKKRERERERERGKGEEAKRYQVGRFPFPTVAERIRFLRCLHENMVGGTFSCIGQKIKKSVKIKKE
jgi:hypothetical protein